MGCWEQGDPLMRLGPVGPEQLIRPINLAQLILVGGRCVPLAPWQETPSQSSLGAHGLSWGPGRPLPPSHPQTRLQKDLHGAG